MRLSDRYHQFERILQLSWSITLGLFAVPWLLSWLVPFGQDTDPGMQMLWFMGALVLMVLASACHLNDLYLPHLCCTIIAIIAMIGDDYTLSMVFLTEHISVAYQPMALAMMALAVIVTLLGIRQGRDDFRRGEKHRTRSLWWLIPELILIGITLAFSFYAVDKMAPPIKLYIGIILLLTCLDAIKGIGRLGAYVWLKLWEETGKGSRSGSFYRQTHRMLSLILAALLALKGYSAALIFGLPALEAIIFVN